MKALASVVLDLATLQQNTLSPHPGVTAVPDASQYLHSSHTARIHQKRLLAYPCIQVGWLLQLPHVLPTLTSMGTWIAAAAHLRCQLE
jgi:hypothetical protein